VEASIPLKKRQPGLRYLAVAAELRRLIEAGQFKAGDRLPGQHEIARRFRVSLTTMRAAIGVLERDGFLRSEHGLGTYVTAPRRSEVRALVVDDDPAAIALMRQIIESEGAEVVTANSGAQALERVSAQEFDVIFLDLVMPGGNGADTFGQFRRMGLKTPVVLVTGTVDATMIASATQHGPLTLIRKPVEVSQVRELFRTIQPSGAGAREAR
jgi:CheY-like chemotaxis protein